MSDLYRLVDSNKRGWKDDEYIDQLRNSGVLIPVIAADEIANVLVKQAVAASGGQLVDREAIDREAMQNVFIAHASDQLNPHFSMTAIDAALDLALDAAIGDGE